jgi:hypothetical protein
MKTIHMLDERDVRSEVNDTISCAYEGKDWCEDGSIRQDIKDLQSEVRTHVVLIKTINEMLKIISKRVGLDDESE